MKKVLSIGFLIGLNIFFMACTAQPTHMELVIKSSNDINFDEDNISSPLMLNIYELESAEQFSKLDFWTLLDKGSERLSGDMISQTKQVIVPNEQQTYKILFDKKAKFLGIIGSFSNIDKNATWRYVINLEQETYNYHDLLIDGYQIKEVK